MGSNISLFHNTYSLFQQLHETLDIILNAVGEKQVPADKISALENRISLKKSNEITSYFQLIEKFLSKIDPLIYQQIPRKLVEEGESIRNQISGFMTEIRTIRARYKGNNYFEKTMEELSRLNSAVEIFINQFYEVWLNHKRDELNTEAFKLKTPPKYLSVVEFWFDTAIIKEAFYGFPQKIDEWWKPIEEWNVLRTSVIEIQKSNRSTQIMIKELFESTILKALFPLNDEILRKELLYFFSHNSLLLEQDSGAIRDKQKFKEMQPKIIQYFEDTMNILLQNLGSTLNLPYTNDASALKNLPQMILDQLHSLQDSLSTQYQGDIQQASSELQKQSSQCNKFIDEVESWFNSMKDYLQPWEKYIQRVQNIITHTRSDIERILSEFETYTKTVKEESYRTDLLQVIEEKTQDLERILHEYETETLAIVEKNFPEIKQIQELITRYKLQVVTVNDEMKTKFHAYRDKDVDLYSSLKFWEGKYEEIRNRIQFTISKLIKNLFIQFQSVVSEEQDLIKKMGNLTADKPVETLNYQFDILRPEAMTEKELKENINILNEKIVEIEGTKQRFETERLKYQEVLGLLLKKTQDLVTKKCVICHKAVDVTSDNFIRCEFCKSLSHYSCGAWWINKYNSCPVCHNVYTVPNNGMYDPDKLEKENEA